LRRWGLLILVVLLFAVPWIVSFVSNAGGRIQVPYDFFLDQLEQGNVQSVVIEGTGIQGMFSSEVAVPPAGGEGSSQRVTQFLTYYPGEVSNELIEELDDRQVRMETRPSGDGNFLNILFTILPFALMIWIFFRLFRRGGQGGGQGLFQIGKSRAKKYERKRKEHTTFDDVAGIESAKMELREVVEFLEDPSKFKEFGAKTPKGVLLVGPPGTGKTLLARAVAGEAEVPFFSISGSDFMEMFVGVGASRVRNLFKEAKKIQPSIIFIDELDSIGRSRGAGLGGGHDEREQTLNQLLSELDGFERDESTVVLAATNRPDILDKALLRPGRFDRQVTTNLPPKKDRVKILEIHARNKPVDESVDLERMASNTPGFSGADLENLLNEAALVAVRQDKKRIEMEDLEAARDKIILGLERTSVVMSDREKRIVSFHESGHAIVAAALPHAEPVHKVTIIPRERSMGVTQQLPEEDRYIYDLAYLENRLAVMMGGRAAEQFKSDTLTSGAENDLKEAQKLARRMVLDWGMSKDFEHVAMGSQRQNVFLGQQIASEKQYSEETNRRIDEAVTELLNTAYETARSTLEENEEALDSIASRLLEDEEITGEDIYGIIESSSKK
jgi:cell division protease FtsH